MEIRRLGPGDEVLAMQAAPLYDRPPHPDAVRAFLADPLSILIVAYLDGEPAGFIRAHELRQFDSRRPQMFLYEIGTEPRFQRRGVARALIAELETLSRASDAEEIFVVTNEENGPAM